MTAISKTVGVLAIQGDYERHHHQIELVGARPIEVRLPRDLEKLDALIIPGGESTTMNIMIDRFQLREPLIRFGRSKPVFGTCAGMIMLGKSIANNISHVQPLGLMDIEVDRNGYGRQVHSFEEKLDANSIRPEDPADGHFYSRAQSHPDGRRHRNAGHLEERPCPDTPGPFAGLGVSR